MTTSIYIATQDVHDFPRDAGYKPLLVGKADASLGIGRSDCTGDSISDKNKFYCEMTGHYWIWKNDLESDIIGLCHYRRFFWLHEIRWRVCMKSFPSIKECEKFLVTKNIAALLKGHDIILPRAYAFSADNIKSQFIRYHGQDHYGLMVDAVHRISPEYDLSLEHTFQRRWEYLSNLMIAKRETFHAYSAWLFRILDWIEHFVDFRDKRNLRLMGYLSERLLNVYVAHHRLRVKEVPQIFIAGFNSSKEDLYIDLRYIKRRYCPWLLTAEQRLRSIFS